mmetsp:Transcript_108314/g.198761  ORF Transcript_108314/g.198761 Transcript_108314/m.198761 type:complete len:100 (-) Transcript_108314:24-323(-)
MTAQLDLVATQLRFFMILLRTLCTLWLRLSHSLSGFAIQHLSTPFLQHIFAVQLGFHTGCNSYDVQNGYLLKTIIDALQTAWLPHLLFFLGQEVRAETM